MKKSQNNSIHASALQVSVSVALMAISAILFASSFRAAPPRQDGFYPPLPAAPEGVGPNPNITLSLPVDSFNTSVPASTVIIEPVSTTLIDPTTTGGSSYIGFQGDFLFDSAVVTFATPQVAAAGLTTAVPWTVSANIINTGPGTFKTLRVSAFVGDGTTGLNGTGTLYNLRMLRVSSNPGDTSSLTWAPVSSGNEFLFIDEN